MSNVINRNNAGGILLERRNLHTRLSEILQKFPLIANVVHEVFLSGGRVLLVGGTVRDLIIGLPAAGDIDIEVHGITLDALAELLAKYGPVNHVGRSFGVLKVGGSMIDWSVPRTDSAGRKPIVTFDQNLSIEDALRRRDVTMNAMAIDLHTGELHDPFGGQGDLEKGVLHAPELKLFIEDPLRFYRVMQFVGRFSMRVGAELEALCKTMDIAEVSRERIEGEFRKLFLLSQQPSKGLRWIAQIGRMRELFPELEKLMHVPQHPEYHPEGDVFEHTMQAVDAAAGAAYENDEEKILILAAAVCHDLGKFSTTTTDVTGRIRSIGHEIAGVPSARLLLGRITANKRLIDMVCTLVRYHMAPGLLAQQQAGLAAYKRLAFKLAPHVNLRQLSLLAYADRAGRNPQKGTPLTTKDPAIDLFCQRAQEAGVFLAAEPPVISGADLVDVIPPGPALGVAVKRAYELQIDTGITDPVELRKRVVKGS